jgi:hypothetical protein
MDGDTPPRPEGEQTMIATDLKIGGLVTVGPKYVMADNTPYIDRGHFEADEWTGQTLRVVGISGQDGLLAPANLAGADESDAVVYIHSRRLTAG